jgi:putative ATP-dependent endonuclease of OLD family
MKITLLRIKNFRSLADVTIHIDNTTVFLGENNVGKTSVVDALRVALSRLADRRTANVSEYDFYMPNKDADPKKSPGITIEMLLGESKTGEWPDGLIQALAEIIQTDPYTDLDCVNIRFTCKYDENTKIFESQWEFLSLNGEPLGGRSGALLNTFLRYVPLFSLKALRDLSDEYSSRSQFWRRLLKSIEIPDDQRQAIAESLEQLNADLLKADAKMGRVTETLGQMQRVIAANAKQEVTIRALPLQPWDLMAKSEIVVQGQGGDARFPLDRHGQGVQSLAVLLLFQAYVEHLLDEAFEKESQALLTLEEPEAHLHPQATRALWNQVEAFSGQKIITTHSPYFVQNVPFRNLRLLRRKGPETEVCWLPAEFSVQIPKSPEFDKWLQAHSGKYSYSDSREELRVKGAVLEDECRDMMTCFTEPATRGAIHAALRELQSKSAVYLSDGELESLQVFVRRMRGEILFARCWILCEGPSEYPLLHQFAEMLGTPLDAHCVAVIDYQNSGSPEAFASLARALGFPWLWFVMAIKLAKIMSNRLLVGDSETLR